MRFSFDVKLTDKDYMQFNEFGLKNSGAVKKSDKLMKIFILLIFVIGGIIILTKDSITPASIIGAIIYWIIGLLLCLTTKKSNTVLTRSYTRILLKDKAKKPYTPESTIEFYDDFFKEIAPDSKSEVSYTAIDKICVIMNSYVFIFIDSLRGYIVPFASFRNAEEEKDFLVFLGTLTPNIEFFDKI